jgi:hypothetical protein
MATRIIQHGKFLQWVLCKAIFWLFWGLNEHGTERKLTVFMIQINFRLLFCFYLKCWALPTGKELLMKWNLHFCLGWWVKNMHAFYWDGTRLNKRCGNWNINKTRASLRHFYCLLLWMNWKHEWKFLELFVGVDCGSSKWMGWEKITFVYPSLSSYKHKRRKIMSDKRLPLAFLLRFGEYENRFFCVSRNFCLRNWKSFSWEELYYRIYLNCIG